MAYPLQERYINLLTDFGFKRIFGTEPNKQLLIDFLNTLLPAHHRIQSVTYKKNENLGRTILDRKAIFDIYCQAENGDRFIVEIQKAKQNFFKDRSVYYSTFPIQEQALKGEWDYQLKSVYMVGVLDFVFNSDSDHEDGDNSDALSIVQLKDENCVVFYEKLKYIYIELPKFTKSVDELETHFDKWVFLLKHLPNLEEPPEPLQETVFGQLFEAAEIANFSSVEQDTYLDSLKYYRDLNNVVNTSRQEARQEGRAEGRVEGRVEGRAEGRAEGTRSLVLRLLARKVGDLADDVEAQVTQLPSENLEALGEALFDFDGLEDLRNWLDDL